MLALAKKVLQSKLRKFDPNLAPGVYQIDTTVLVTVRGTVTKLEDEQVTPTVSIPLKATMALLLEKAGVTRDRAAQLLAEAMQAALTLDLKGSETVRGYISDIEQAEELVSATLKALPKVPKTGKTLVDAEITIDPVMEEIENTPVH